MAELSQEIQFMSVSRYIFAAVGCTKSTIVPASSLDKL